MEDPASRGCNQGEPSPFYSPFGSIALMKLRLRLTLANATCLYKSFMAHV